MSVNLRGNQYTTALVHIHWNPNGSLSFSDRGDGTGDVPQMLGHLSEGISLNYYLINRIGNVIFTAPNDNMDGLLPEKTLFGISVMF